MVTALVLYDHSLELVPSRLLPDMSPQLPKASNRMCALCTAPTTRLAFLHSKNGFTVFQKTSSVKICAMKSEIVVEGCQIPETGVMHLSFPVPNRKHTPDCSAPERSANRALLSHQLRAETPLFEDTNIASVSHCGRCELSEGQLLEERSRFQIRQTPSLHPGSFADARHKLLEARQRRRCVHKFKGSLGSYNKAGAQGLSCRGLLVLVVRVNVQSSVLPGDGIRMLSEVPLPHPR